MPELQSKLLARFAQSLHHDGFLVLGPQDGIDHLARKAGFIPYIKGSHIYRVGDHASNGELNE
jgi:chemotaxis protein methyltransferase CheR